MTRDDVLAIGPGDSVIGLRGVWRDELPVVDVGALLHSEGVLRREVAVRNGPAVQRGIVIENDRTIRGARHW